MSKNKLRFLWQQIPSTTVSEILCGSGMTGVVLDLEHGIFNDETAFQCIRIIKSLGKKCMARVPKDYAHPHYWLDAGVDGLIFSTVESYDQAKLLFEKCLFAPDGTRGLGLVRQNFWGKNKLIDDGRPILIAQIENKIGAENIFDIVKIDFDYFMVGPYDLSLSLGLPGNFDNDLYRKCFISIKDAVKDKLGYHIVKDIEGQIGGLNDCGFLAFGTDSLMLINGVEIMESYI